MIRRAALAALTTALLALPLAATAPAPAQAQAQAAPAAPSSTAAGTLTYVKGHNVWVARADGTQARQVTTGGTAATPWRSPTSSDDGHIVAGRGNLVYRMDQWGTVLGVLDPPDIPSSAGELLGGPPAHLAVSPDGTKIAYTYEKYSCPVNLACRIRYVTAFTSSTSVTPPGTWGVVYHDNPSWITDSRVAVNADLIDNINLFDLGRGSTHWFDEDDYTTDDQPIFDFEVSRTAPYAAVIRSTGDDAHVMFYRVSGNYRTGGRPPIPETFCATTPQLGTATPTLSADGERGAWAEPDGIWMMLLGPTAPCTVQPTRVIPGGSAPSYSPAALQAVRPTYAFTVVRAPRVTGTAKAGRRLKATAPVLAPAAAGLRYQWLRDDRPIARATGTGYKVTKKDRGHRIRVRVTGTRAGFRTKTVVSAAVRVRR
ncbi:hypothetical protein GUY44_16405 [Pimelobacter simplex]|uniref:Hemagglutinin protein n=1 Tax=Nocardioides simplex TaxID=2045 RepID=A0A0A1DI09_NOCSI|nr:hypothetical protein [Pimelobacter simplex]AIY16929.1 Hemagglutinin protein [Pimelobacter simplex]MCG8152072.1 hypothetical protein [Pimelobacter simplex]GEB12825.1 hypothetical protein NSI01_11400 [Pimelobacter simplex]SFM53697.1 hypothetical protein SAMN05421671_2204 [Pimelobacter simplex]